MGGRAVGVPGFYALAVLVGIVAGGGAIVFRGLIALFHNLLFLGQVSLVYDANVHTPASPWGPLVILAPVLAALVVAFLVKNFAPEAKGHGVPEVLEAIYFEKGVIRPIVAVIKSIASALSIGSGGSAGREGPMIQVGASFGSTLGQWFPLPPWQRIALVAAGAGGGIAASFNTPVGGILFAVEIIMHELSVRTLVPVAIATVTATYISRLVFGAHPSFVIPALELLDFHVMNLGALLAYVGLGIVMGMAATLFIKSLYGFEDLFDNRLPGSYYTRHAGAMLLVGVMFYVMMYAFGHYYVQGVGYATVQDVLSSTLVAAPFLLLLFALKMIATSLTLGSGASGGVFSPAFFMGGTLGGAYGLILARLVPELSISPPAFAVAGMAGMVGASTGAAVAAIVMIFEMTLDYSVIIPMTVTVALAYGVRTMLSKESIYTMKLVRRGRHVPDALRANLFELQPAESLMDRRVVTVQASDTLAEAAARTAPDASASYLLVEDQGRVVGILQPGRATALLAQGQPALRAGDVAGRDYVAVAETSPLFEVLAAMHAGNASVALVSRRQEAISAEDVRGVIALPQIADALADAGDLFAD